MDFQDGGRSGHSGHLEFPIGTILAIFFYLQVILILPIKFQVLDFRLKRRNSKKIFKMAVSLDFRSETTLGIFDPQTTPILATKFRDNWPFGSGEEVQNRFSRWIPS